MCYRVLPCFTVFYGVLVEKLELSAGNFFLLPKELLNPRNSGGVDSYSLMLREASWGFEKFW